MHNGGRFVCLMKVSRKETSFTGTHRRSLCLAQQVLRKKKKIPERRNAVLWNRGGRSPSYVCTPLDGARFCKRFSREQKTPPESKIVHWNASSIVVAHRSARSPQQEKDSREKNAVLWNRGVASRALQSFSRK